MVSYLLVGRMGSGKDTVAGFLEEEGKQPIAFADELKRLVKTLRNEGPVKTYDYAKNLFLIPPDDLMEALVSYSKYPKEPKDRTLLQELGTNYCRHIDPNIWVRALANRMSQDEDYVVTDCRFTNEFEAFRERFVSIHLICPDEVRHERLNLRDGYCNRDRDKHESEQSIERIGEHCMLWLDTHCSLEELKNRVKRLSVSMEAMYGVSRLCG